MNARMLPARATLALLFAIPVLSPLSALAGEPQLVRRIDDIAEYKLDNGMKVLLLRDVSKPTVTVNMTILVGSMNENYGETGMAHLLEHMVFKGTPTFSNVPRSLTEHGAAWNGTTWTDRTNYFETMPARDENLEFGIKLEADRLVNSFIRKSDLDSEMTVVRNEMEAGENSPTGILSERMSSTAYLFHGYGHSTIGARSDVEQVPIERLQAFYKYWYQPDNSILIIAGKFDEAKALKWVQTYCGALPKPTRVLPPHYTVEPPQDGERSVVLKRVGETAAVGATYHVPAGPHPDSAAIEFLGRILGDTPGGRLHKALITTNKAASVSVSPLQFRDPGIFEVMLEVSKGQSAAEARQILLNTLDAAATTPVTAQELEAARSGIDKARQMLLADSARFAVELSDWAAMGDWRLYFVHQDRLKAVTAEQIQAVAARYLQSTNRTVGEYQPVTTPARVEIPEVGNVSAMADSYKPAPREASTVDEIVVDATALEARLQRLTLPGGLRLVMLPRETRSDMLSLNLILPFGNEKNLPPSEYLINAALAEMLMRGTTSYNRQALKERLDSLKAQVRIYGGSTSTSIMVTTDRSNLPGVLEVIREVLRSPTFDEAELNQFKIESLAKLDEFIHEPTMLAGNALQNYLWPEDHPRYSPTFEKQIEFYKSLNRDMLVRFYRDYYGASAASLSAVGDFDPATVSDWAKSTLDSWRAPKDAVRRALRAPSQKAALRKDINTADKANASLGGGITFSLSKDSPDYPALQLAVQIIGGEGMSSRLGTRLRQKEGLSYGVWGYLATPSLGDSSMFGTGAILAPENAARGAQCMLEELDRAIKDGFTKEEIESGKSSWLQRDELSLSTDAGTAAALTELSGRGKTLKDWESFRKDMQAVTAQQAQQAVRKYITLDKFCLIKAGDFEKLKK